MKSGNRGTKRAGTKKMRSVLRMGSDLCIEIALVHWRNYRCTCRTIIWETILRRNSCYRTLSAMINDTMVDLSNSRRTMLLERMLPPQVDARPVVQKQYEAAGRNRNDGVILADQPAKPTKAAASTDADCAALWNKFLATLPNANNPLWHWQRT